MFKDLDKTFFLLGNNISMIIKYIKSPLILDNITIVYIIAPVIFDLYSIFDSIALRIKFKRYTS